MPLPLAVMPVLVLGVSNGGGFLTISGRTGSGNFVRSVSVSPDELEVLVWDLSGIKFEGRDNLRCLAFSKAKVPLKAQLIFCSNHMTI